MINRAMNKLSVLKHVKVSVVNQIFIKFSHQLEGLSLLVVLWKHDLIDRRLNQDFHSFCLVKFPSVINRPITPLVRDILNGSISDKRLDCLFFAIPGLPVHGCKTCVHILAVRVSPVFKQNVDSLLPISTLCLVVVNAGKKQRRIVVYIFHVDVVVKVFLEILKILRCSSKLLYVQFQNSRVLIQAALMKNCSS